MTSTLPSPVPRTGRDHIPSRKPGRPVGVAILGSTGSIGRQTLDVIEHLPERFRVVALAAHRNLRQLAEQVTRHRPSIVACDNIEEAQSLGLHDCQMMTGANGLIEAATHPDVEIVVVATSGHAGILPTVRAIEAGKTIALANKESIVCAGELIVPLALERGVPIHPVDSEHSAIWQALGSAPTAEVSRLYLTASGGPFRTTPAEELRKVTAAEALAHPTWRMGGKITVDSATLMNKGLELIEAQRLFGIPYDRIEVVVHPESIVHSIVEFADGSQLAQLSLPDMRLPIQYALTFPDRLPSPCQRLDLTAIGALHFEPPDTNRFPALSLSRSAGVAGQTYPTVLSAADEVAVEAFLAGQLSFPGITEVVARTLDAHTPQPVTDLEVVLEADRWARAEARRLIQACGAQ
ncbi:MAG TPA: 1-deoxy-D-xylulose-5-phosphate reductoisomerase [Thermomicrobiales bacterium]